MSSLRMGYRDYFLNVEMAIFHSLKSFLLAMRSLLLFLLPFTCTLELSRKVFVSVCKSLQIMLDNFLSAVVSLQVQNLIERCLQLYMNQKEVVDTLLEQAKIEPSFTELGNLNTFRVLFEIISI